MKDRYYTPDISEFHVGFEYEYYNDTTSEWNPAELGGNIHNVPLFFAGLNPAECRVKYLNEKDLEDLGFLNGATYSMSCWLPKMNNNHGDMHSLQIDFHGPGYVCIYGDLNAGTNDGVVFSGKVKNKSELKRILTQIGYFE